MIGGDFVTNLKLIVGKVLAAEASSPAVHGALRALQAAVVAVLVAVVRSQLGI